MTGKENGSDCFSPAFLCGRKLQISDIEHTLKVDYNGNVFLYRNEKGRLAGRGFSEDKNPKQCLAFLKKKFPTLDEQSAESAEKSAEKIGLYGWSDIRHEKDYAF
ncbi:MAG: hypothetical protein NC314_05675 [Roseburia sp.]|nr:hypothetical protein [Roseburia sp.]MCM1242312.1 hypothetical protein [Roseburia sp.]